MDRGILEGLATALYARLGHDTAAPVDTFRLARGLLGPDAIERGTGIAGLAARVFVVRGQRRIAVNRRLPFACARFYVGHELAHVILAEEGYRGDDLEACCDYLGAALLAPMPAVCALLRAFGRDHEAIADEVYSTQTWAALRVAECLGMPRAVVAPKRLYVRGPDDFVWGDERRVRQLAREGRPGIARARLTDDPRRVVVDVEDAG